MSENSCWIEYKSDRALQKRISEGWYSDDEQDCLPIDSFPPHPSNWSWFGVLREWCEANEIKFQVVEGTTVVARVKRAQIREFLAFAYGDSPFYHDPEKMLTWKGRPHLACRLLELQAFVAQELNPRLWYEIMAYAD